MPFEIKFGHIPKSKKIIIKMKNEKPVFQNYINRLNMEVVGLDAKFY